MEERAEVMAIDEGLSCRIATMAAAMHLLALLYRRAPDSDAVETILGIEDEGDDFILANPKCKEGIGLMKSYLSDNEHLIPARNDFHDLFVGPHELLAVPWSSAYLDPGRMLFGPTAIKVKEVFAAEGFEIPEGSAEPSDHVAYEWEFLSALHMRALRDAEEGNSDSAADAMKVAEGFFHKLLCPWMEPFCNDIVRGAQTDYARGLAAFTMGIVELETGLLSFKMSTNL